MACDVWGGADPLQKVGRHLENTDACQGAKNEGHPQAMRCCPGCLQCISDFDAEDHQKIDCLIPVSFAG